MVPTAFGAPCALDLDPSLPVEVAGPLVIAHRGASGYLPEHTLAAYAVAILQGADYVEPDLVMTRDGVLVVRHDNALHLTTDIADRPEFAARRTTKTVDGEEVTGWFSEDLSAKEIATLRAIERIGKTRPGNTRFDRQFGVPTLDQVIDLVQAMERVVCRRVGLYPETKHPTHFDRLGLSLEEPLVRALHDRGYRGRRARVFIQSFETRNLHDLDALTELPLVQLLADEGRPADVAAAGGTLTYSEMATPEGLRAIAAYASGVGPERRRFLLRERADGGLDRSAATSFVADAHRAGLVVHPYTFRAENQFLAAANRSAGGDAAPGDLVAELAVYLALGIDGFFTDQPDIGRRAVAQGGR